MSKTIVHINQSVTPGLNAFVEAVNYFRLDASRRLDAKRRTELGQFFTSPSLGRFMASMFEARSQNVQLLDAGTGVGSLSAAFVAEALGWRNSPKEISVTAYEIDQHLLEYLEVTFESCLKECERAGTNFTTEIFNEDFIEAGVRMIGGKLISPRQQTFNYAILNPPYRKINSESETRLLLRTIDIETSNFYTAFLSIVARLLEPDSELVAITPRSFCNGPYFRPFRKSFLEMMTIRRIHLFDSRDSAFQDDEILQENIIFHAVKKDTKKNGQGGKTAKVLISSSAGPDDNDIVSQEVEADQLVRPDDPDSFIHIVLDELGHSVAQHMGTFTASLDDLGLKVSTGRVVDFRAKEFLRADMGKGTAPLIYPTHFSKGDINWPKPGGKKPNALQVTPETEHLLVPAGVYVLVKRFTAKEERRRIVAAVYDPARVKATRVGFENHLNYYHSNGNGCSPSLARGLVAFLNSTLVDSYFRQFNGHTQVNATDLRSFKYPSKEVLELLGARIGNELPEQDELDRLVEEELLNMSNDPVSESIDPVQAKKKIEEAKAVLNDLGLPRAQQNERSALTLLSLLGLHPETPWAEASAPLRGITQMMDFFALYYGKRYAPNSRETVRRQTIHQFVDAGFVVPNPDDPSRSINSGKNVYQIEADALKLLRTYGTEKWHENLKTYLTSVKTLQTRYAQARQMNRIPINVAPGKTLTLSPGGQNVLVEKIINEFCPRFTPGGNMIYVGDTDEKWAYFNKEALEALGVSIDVHGKMPDVVVHHADKNWLVLIEAVTSQGPVNPKRRGELEILFHNSTCGLVFVTAFLTMKTMTKYLNDISWETEVWVAGSPDHMIHFNGERFLGPH
jgi:adenine-specific DNA-methyltransferase